MTETYLSLGPRADWHWNVPMGAIFVAMPFLLKPLTKSLGGKVNPMHWGMFAWGIWMIAGSILGAPESTMTLVMPIFLAAAMLAPWNDARMPVWGRAVAFVAFMALGWSGISREIGRERIVLSDGGAEYRRTPSEQMHDLPRVGLTIIGYRDIRNQPAGDYGWMIQRQNHLGVDIQGKELYWGPHGVTLGDDVAKRIALWAGVKLGYDNFWL